ncbi:MAG: hypothetical protein ACI8Q6_000510, partial [Granulosicoccus sp.]
MVVNGYSNLKSAFGANSDWGGKYGDSVIAAEKSIAKLALVAVKQAQNFRTLKKD